MAAGTFAINLIPNWEVFLFALCWASIPVSSEVPVWKGVSLAFDGGPQRTVEILQEMETPDH